MPGHTHSPCLGTYRGECVLGGLTRLEKSTTDERGFDVKRRPCECAEGKALWGAAIELAARFSAFVPMPLSRTCSNPLTIGDAANQTTN